MSDGFSEMIDRAIGFFVKLAADNSKPFYEAHKDFYRDEIRKPAELMADLFAEDLAKATGNAKAAALANGVEAATQGILDHERSPGRKVGQPDNRDSHYWFARYWAEALADGELSTYFNPVAEALADNEDKIVAELSAVRGKPADIGGYYKADPEKLAAVMRPSATLNAIFD